MFRVDTPDGARYALRVHRPGNHGRDAVRSELAWVHGPARGRRRSHPGRGPGHRRRQGCVAARRHLVRALRMGRAASIRAATRLEPELFEQLGTLAARMHRHARRWRRPAWFTRHAWDADGCLGPRARWGRWEDGAGVGPAERDGARRGRWRCCAAGYARSAQDRTGSGWCTRTCGPRTCSSRRDRRDRAVGARARLRRLRVGLVPLRPGRRAVVRRGLPPRAGAGRRLGARLPGRGARCPRRRWPSSTRSCCSGACCWWPGSVPIRTPTSPALSAPPSPPPAASSPRAI